MEAAGSCSAIPQHSHKTKNQKNPKPILLPLQINNGNSWLLEFEKPMEMDYKIQQHLNWGRRKGWVTPQAGRSGSTCRNIKAAPNPSLPEQLRAKAIGILEVPQEGLPVFHLLELCLILFFHFLTLQPLPQLPGILWRFGKAAEGFSQKC